MRRLGLLLVAALIGACDFGTLDDLNADQAVQGGDELTVQAKKLWNVYDGARPNSSDADVKKAIADIEGVVARAGSLPLTVKINQLAPEDLAVVGMQTKDPAHAQGMLLIKEVGCSLDQLSKLVVAKNQTELYPKLYDTYTRDYTSDVNAFLGGGPTVTWTTHYQASALSRTYQSTVLGGARRVPNGMPSGAPVFLDRAYLQEPAVFTQGGNDSGFDQDYQIELYYERAPGRTLHFYALWREFHISTLTSESDLYVNIVLGNLSDFDDRSSKVCKDNAPAPTFQ